MKYARLFRFTLALLAAFVTAISAGAQELPGRWPVERAQAWERETGWPVPAARRGGHTPGRSTRHEPAGDVGNGRGTEARQGAIRVFWSGMRIDG